MRFAEVDLNEDEDIDADINGDAGDSDSEEEEEEGEPDEFIDVLDILDGRGEPESEDEPQKVSQQGSSREEGSDREMFDEGQENSSGDEDNEEEEEDNDVASVLALSVSDDETEADDTALQTLESYITKLDSGQKRKAPEDESPARDHAHDDRSRKRRMLKEQTQVGIESEFAAQPGEGTSLRHKSSARIHN